MKPKPVKHFLDHYTAFGARLACGIMAGSYLASPMKVGFSYPLTRQTRIVTCRRCMKTDLFVKAVAAREISQKRGRR